MGQGRVLVTGATGFVAGQCVAELLARGYSVRGTVRDLATADVAHLRPLAERHGGTLEFAQARLDADEGWVRAADGCDYVLHVASPIPFKAPKHEDEIIRPAVDGTLRVLNAAAKAGVRRVVCTGSTDAIAHNSGTAGRVRTEDDWSDPAECGAYAKSKIQAERTGRGSSPTTTRWSWRSSCPAPSSGRRRGWSERVRPTWSAGCWPARCR